MNETEIENIKTKDFNDLWIELWNNDKNRLNHLKREYFNSKNKFEQLKNNINTEISLDFFTNNVKPLYNINEWGFPKGRKDRYEDSLHCAQREFNEETNINLSDIKIINEIEPIEEELIGTNGIKYKHIYYVAEVINSNLPDITNNNEIGAIGYFNYNDCISLIREYHYEKKNIIFALYLYYIDKLSKIT